MKKPKVIRFRCQCFECGSDDILAHDGLRSAAAESGRSDEKSRETDPRLKADVVGKLLFGA
ncbi:hypothetical protein [Rhizobium sp. CCGE531]|uniref:hypothetical protein n=1 Tax=Rhizobium sp. CCGE531 TaxID=2364271 RepID=UPI000EA960C8|nr:hypothetical protein [Rhizobium sp. CCGE531]AYG66536.1 hypothetical protein CCGE531_11405 [Rhizobium sp. CCGE531]AYG72917.1 hypothetical protein CCGE532_10830 [Rhizobium sp. CCGE532]